MLLVAPMLLACSVAQTYGPPVLDAAMKHFVQVLEDQRVQIDKQHVKCDVEMHKGTVLMLCEADLPGASK